MGSVLKIADGISVIDTGYIREEFAAIYLLRQGNEIAIIETGTKHSIPNIQQALEKDGLSFSSVAYIIPTHMCRNHRSVACRLHNGIVYGNGGNFLKGIFVEADEIHI